MNLDAFLGAWRSIDRSSGGIDLDVRRRGTRFVIQRYAPWGMPVGLPLQAVAQGAELVATDLGNDETGTIRLTLAADLRTLELRLPDAQRPIHFRRLGKGERLGQAQSPGR